MRWKRRLKPLNPNTRRDVVFKDHPRYTLMDVYAPDTLGLLYRITEAISRLQLNIAFAKIATRVDGVVDSFYILDSQGGKLKTQAERRSAKKEILAVINHTTASELVLAQKDR